MCVCVQCNAVQRSATQSAALNCDCTVLIVKTANAVCGSHCNGACLRCGIACQVSVVFAAKSLKKLCCAQGTKFVEICVATLQN